MERYGSSVDGSFSIGNSCRATGWEAIRFLTSRGSVMNSVGHGLIAACVIGGLLTTGCADKDGLRIQLEARRPLLNDAHRLGIPAQGQGPQEGLRDKMVSAQGEFDPQESYAPRSSFT